MTFIDRQTNNYFKDMGYQDAASGNPPRLMHIYAYKYGYEAYATEVEMKRKIHEACKGIRNRTAD
jgi:hypothetical protein